MSDEELTGWKAVAAHLRVSVRSAQEFEKKRGLPIHRGAGTKAPVFAYVRELENWKLGSDPCPRPCSKPLVPESADDAKACQDDGAISKPRFGDHFPFVLTSSFIASAMVASSVVMELAFRYDEFRKVINLVTPLVWLGTIATLASVLASISVRFRRGESYPLPLALFLLGIANAIGYLGVRPFMPDVQVTLASFQTWTAQAAYLKSVVYCTIFTYFFLFIPFHSVEALELEVRRGRGFDIYLLLAKFPRAVAPPGTVFFRPVFLWAMLVVGGMYSLISSAHLLEALKQTAFTNLFILTIQIRWILFLALGSQSCWWYYTSLERIKRECVAAGASRVTEQSSSAAADLHSTPKSPPNSAENSISHQ